MGDTGRGAGVITGDEAGHSTNGVLSPLAFSLLFFLFSLGS